MNNLSVKIEKVRQVIGEFYLAGVRLRGVDWFSWATDGGDSAVIFSSEIGIAEVLITPDRAYVLTNDIERDRLVEEEVPEAYAVKAFPWENLEAINQFIRSVATASGRMIASDRPTGRECALPEKLIELKRGLAPDEIARYFSLGNDAASAMTESLAAATPEMTEVELAGIGAKALWARGIHPLLTLVGGESRVERFRHPVATEAPLGERAMMVFCGRRGGLFANLTRQIFFRPLQESELQAIKVVTKVEAEAFAGMRAGKTLAEIYALLGNRYEALGHGPEIRKHHQGGPTGYLSRESIAVPGNHWKCRPNVAYAWNPSLPGIKIEDTVLLNEQNEIEVLTHDPEWPAYEDGRPTPWVRA